MQKKKLTVPKVRTAPADPQEKRLGYVLAGGTETVDVEAAQPAPPALVLSLAAKAGITPWLWTVASDHVTIISTSGQKFRFEQKN